VVYGVAFVGTRALVPSLRGSTLDRLRSSLR
jgi:hypothetical protein